MIGVFLSGRTRRRERTTGIFRGRGVAQTLIDHAAGQGVPFAMRFISLQSGMVENAFVRYAHPITCWRGEQYGDDCGQAAVERYRR